MEQFVLFFVCMPHKGTFDFGEFQVLAIQLGDDFRAPLVFKQSEFLMEVDRFHGVQGCGAQYDDSKSVAKKRCTVYTIKSLITCELLINLSGN